MSGEIENAHQIIKNIVLSIYILKKILILIKKHEIGNKHIQGIKSMKKYKRGFAIRTCLLLTL